MKSLLIFAFCSVCSLSTYAQTVLEVGESKTFYPGDRITDAQVSDPSVISISSVTPTAGTTGVKVTAIKAGIATCNVAYVSGNLLKQTSYLIEVIDIKSITIPQTLTLTVGEEYKFTPIIQDSRMERYLLEWTSLDTSIATIDSDYIVKSPTPGVVGGITTTYVRGGNLTTHKPGTTTVMCSYKNVSAVCQVTVEPIYVSEINFEKNEYELTTYQSIQLEPNILPSNATKKDITWKSSNTSVAIVDNKGKVTGLNNGKAIIIATAADGSMTMGSYVVTVTPDEKEELDINFKIDNYAQFSTKVESGAPFSINVQPPTTDWKIESFNVNGVNTLNQLINGVYSIDQVENPMNIDATFAYDGLLQFYDLTTGAESMVDNSTIRISKSGNMLNLNNIKIGADVRIYTVGGQLVGSHKCQSNSMKIELDSNYYIIMVDNISFKVKI